jgi:hypothetical protein
MTPSTAYSRDLGDELRRLRETCTGLSGNKLAEKLGWDPSKVSTVEHGKARASEIDLIQYLSMCGKDIDYVNDFRRRYQYAFDEYIVQVSDNLRTVAMAEATATGITSYSPQAVPGLTQTPEYADGLYRMTGMVTEARIPTLVQFRIDRQTVLRRHDRPTCLFYVHEHALQLQIGNAHVMEDQYARLLFHTHTIRIVPADTLGVRESPAGGLQRVRAHERVRAGPRCHRENSSPLRSPGSTRLECGTIAEQAGGLRQPTARGTR